MPERSTAAILVELNADIAIAEQSEVRSILISLDGLIAIRDVLAHERRTRAEFEDQAREYGAKVDHITALIRETDVVVSRRVSIESQHFGRPPVAMLRCDVVADILGMQR